ncbi:MAG: hypothetical protein IH849_05320 [Acidobacteria bacterium]|nr:hypothetical protein [Acidobacteriota bacterium]
MVLPAFDGDLLFVMQQGAKKPCLDETRVHYGDFRRHRDVLDSGGCEVVGAIRVPYGELPADVSVAERRVGRAIGDPQKKGDEKR